MILVYPLQEAEAAALSQGQNLPAQKRIFKTWNQLFYTEKNPAGPFFVITKACSRLPLSKKQDTQGIDYYEGSFALDLKLGQVVQEPFGRINVLMNTSIIDDKWCYPALKPIIKSYEQVCVLAFSFFNDTKNLSDWNKQYAPGQGIWYRANQDVFYKYGIKPEQIQWVNYFTDTPQQMLNTVLNSSLVLLTGGAPDLMMKRIKEKKLLKALKNYQGIVLGYSAGAMIQIDSYHIAPDEDYPEYKRCSGLGHISAFDVEVHFKNTNTQLAAISRAQKERNRPMYGIYELGGVIVDQKQNVTCFGQADFFGEVV